jgi:hypothetical protein
LSEQRVRYANKSQVDRAAEFARPHLDGEIAAIEFCPDGTIRVLSTSAFPAPAGAETVEQEIARWREKRGK